MKRGACIGSMLLVVGLVGASQAQRAGDEDNERAAPSAQTDEQSEAKRTGDRAPSAGADEAEPGARFEPSEQISADRAVSFPVDI